jgi:hypothetical protein
MKHTNDDASKQQGSNTDQHRKTNNAQNGKNEGTGQHGHSSGTKDQGSKQGADTSNWQKDKQNNKK